MQVRNPGAVWLGGSGSASDERTVVICSGLEELLPRLCSVVPCHVQRRAALGLLRDPFQSKRSKAKRIENLIKKTVFGLNTCGFGHICTLVSLSTATLAYGNQVLVSEGRNIREFKGVFNFSFICTQGSGPFLAVLGTASITQLYSLGDLAVLGSTGGRYMQGICLNP